MKGEPSIGYQLFRNWVSDEHPISPREEAELILRLARKVMQ